MIYRVGSHVAAPGVDVQAMIDYFQSQSKGGGLLGLYDLFVGGNLSRATIFALGIMPYISASIFAQIGAAVFPSLDKMQKDEEGRKTITQWTRYVTVLLAMVQAWGFALFTESVQGAVATPSFAFKLQMTFVLTTGAIFVMWLGEQITERGLGNGASLMIFFSIVERFWPGIGDTYRLYTTGATEPARPDRARRADGRRRRRRRDDHDRGAAHRDPDPAALDGAGADEGGGARIHSAPHQFGRRHADHLRAVGDRGAWRARAGERQRMRSRDIAEYLDAGNGDYLVSRRS